MNKAEWIELLNEVARKMAQEGDRSGLETLKQTCMDTTHAWVKANFPELISSWADAPEVSKKKALSEKARKMYDKVVNRSSFESYTEGLLEVLGLLIEEDLITRYRESRQSGTNPNYLQLDYGLIIVPIEQTMRHNYERNRPVMIFDPALGQNRGWRLSYDRGEVEGEQIGIVRGVGNHLPIARSAIVPATPRQINEYFEVLENEITARTFWP